MYIGLQVRVLVWTSRQKTGIFYPVNVKKSVTIKFYNKLLWKGQVESRQKQWTVTAFLELDKVK